MPRLVAAGYRAIVPYLRGYGATRFLAAETLRSGQQAAIGRDLLDLMDALKLPRSALVGFDWGGPRLLMPSCRSTSVVLTGSDSEPELQSHFI